MTTPTLCPACNQPHRTFDQPGLIPGKPTIHQADCQTRDCPLYAVTLEVGAHARLTPAEIDAYRAARSPQLVTMTHPITGKTIRINPAFTQGVIWLPPNAADITDETVAELREVLNVELFAKAVAPHVLPSLAVIPGAPQPVDS